MNKKIGILIVFIAAALFIWGLISVLSLTIIKYQGTAIKATIIKVDTNCDKYNKIEVLYESQSYSVPISRASCREGIYKVGQQVTLIKHKNNSTLIWPESQPEWIPLLLAVVLALAYYTNRGKFALGKQK